ncbi:MULTISPECIES: NAD-dependent epimerase/dehydratase family protein [unclassified Pseudomonas]|uniref:NAD-dependent epimerase n=1 Tax=Pseudomonas gorinensis TaxID=3240790 RepID=A0ACA7P378_9PSED|nr:MULTISPECIES: NAD-dependent epimerase/dehydratase family protein [unclassified Pseudomonas]AHC34418.1 NAD-dependent epimerase [Pseudomonas sp. TKP]MBL1309985.1 NAD-dependent epimerase/dehydratase family protein [Pseudomonas sp.]PMX05322.1 NAD-dependent dehydratase [Pseudomonas sp. MPBC4-3]PMX42156.1 NAD-dependent dehydratase [Pseudomonas sp. FW301-21B01]PMY02844.1 NAD-dependent dehydratase [Pseudomonas sp. MPR-R5A]
MRVLVTGATGFVGRGLIRACADSDGIDIVAALRNSQSYSEPHVDVVVMGDISEGVDWTRALEGVDVVVHLAGRAHVIGEAAADALAKFRAVNLEGTTALARQARDAGVKRFILISSIGVNGARTIDKPFEEESIPTPHADYAVSKLEAEQALRQTAQGSTMEWVIVRPPLVYGAQAPGNFGRLLKLVSYGLPLPFASVKNSRSMISLENLAHFLRQCITHPGAANQLFLISDGIALSTAEIISHLAIGMGVKTRLLPCPPVLMRWGANMLGRPGMYTQLCESLVIDSCKANSLLDWVPPLLPGFALQECGRAFRALRP